jgi:hypothetical protein
MIKILRDALIWGTTLLMMWIIGSIVDKVAKIYNRQRSELNE